MYTNMSQIFFLSTKTYETVHGIYVHKIYANVKNMYQVCTHTKHHNLHVHKYVPNRILPQRLDARHHHGIYVHWIYTNVKIGTKYVLTQNIIFTCIWIFNKSHSSSTPPRRKKIYMYMNMYQILHVYKYVQIFSTDIYPCIYIRTKFCSSSSPPRMTPYTACSAPMPSFLRPRRRDHRRRHLFLFFLSMSPIHVYMYIMYISHYQCGTMGWLQLVSSFKL